jgi:cytochrome c
VTGKRIFNMHPLPRFLFGVLPLVAMTAANETQAVDLGLLKRHCGTCHTSEQDTVQAPSFKSIAQRYKNGDATVKAQLAQSIRKGSAGKWGKTSAMPEEPRVSSLDARKLTEWVLGF